MERVGYCAKAELFLSYDLYLVYLFAKIDAVLYTSKVPARGGKVRINFLENYASCKQALG